MDYIATLLTVVIGFLCLHVADGVCSEPTNPSNSYPLTESKSSYNTGDVYEILCVPGYKISGTSKLTCLPTGKWDNEHPSCSPAEGTYPWWLLLILVVTVLILIPCVLPRIIFYICCRKKKRQHKNDERNDDDRENEDCNDTPYQGGGDQWKHGGTQQNVMEPITNYGQKRMSNMDAMKMFYPNSDRKQLARASTNTKY